MRGEREKGPTCYWIKKPTGTLPHSELHPPSLKKKSESRRFIEQSPINLLTKNQIETLPHSEVHPPSLRLLGVIEQRTSYNPFLFTSHCVFFNTLALFCSVYTNVQHKSPVKVYAPLLCLTQDIILYMHMQINLPLFNSICVKCVLFSTLEYHLSSKQVKWTVKSKIYKRYFFIIWIILKKKKTQFVQHMISLEHNCMYFWYGYCMRTLTRYSRINYMDQCITK